MPYYLERCVKTQKDMDKYSKFKVAYCLNICLVVLGIVGLIVSIHSNGLGLFSYYTQDSNILGLLSSLCFVITGYEGFKRGEVKTNNFVSKFRFMATSCMCLTFLVVVFVLIPLAGFKWTGWYLFGGANLYYHTLCPIISFISFTFFEDVVNLRFVNTAINFIPTVIYAAVTITLNALNVMYGPYPFLRVHEQSVLASVIWFIVIVGGSWGLSILVYILKKKNLKAA